MNFSKKLLRTLNFEKMTEGGAFVETFYPWDAVVSHWMEVGFPQKFTAQYLYPPATDHSQRYFSDLFTEPVYEYEQVFGLDGVKRMAFRIPFSCFDTETLDETEEYILRRDEDGWQRKYYKNRKLVLDVKPVVADEDDWNSLKETIEKEEALNCTDEKLQEVYGKYAEGNKRGDFSIRFRASGFFWTARTLMGAEEHLFAFYEMPELLHDINEFVLSKYLKYFDKIFDLIQPEVILFEEDLSGVNGPMISPSMFDEFVGSYYKKLVPFLKKKGIKNIFVDTDGDFKQLIPNFMEAGIDGFLPMDVNAGMDIVEVRKQFPGLKFIGGFNKLAIAAGKEAIDQEFARIMPVIRQGGYVPGVDHQVAPSTPLENYWYYLKRLKEAMKHAGADCE